MEEWKNLERVLEEYATSVRDTYRGYLQSEGVNASGSLSQSATVNIEVNNNIYEVSLNLNEYWKWIEGGRPPTENDGNGELRRAIKQWIRVKGIIPRPLEDGKLPTENQLAYLISRKIHTLGYEGKGLLQKSIDDNEEFMERIENAMLEDVALFAEKIIFKVTIS